MKQLAKIINEQTGLCDIALGDNTKFFLSQGFVELDVQKSDIDGNLYLTDKCPMKSDEEKAKEERERLDNLSMTRGDVFEALILAKGLGKAQIRTMIEQAKLDTVTKALYLNRFDEALEFYRGYPIFDMLGQTLGITNEMLDKFFDTKDYHNLISCKLTINPTPENATVTITPEIIPYGTTAHYKVECDGYITKEGDIKMVKDEVLEVVLDENTTDTEQPTDISNEVEAKATHEPNAN